MPANPLRNPQAWNAIAFNSKAAPGLAKVSVSARVYEIDKKPGKGIQGSRLTYQGFPSSEFSVRLEFWTADQIDEWYAYRPTISLDGTKKEVQAISVAHPIFAELGVDKVVIGKIGSLEPEAGNLFSVTIECTEFRNLPKENVTTTPAGASTGTLSGTGPGSGTAGQGTGTTAQDVQDKEIARLLDEAKKV